MRFVVFGAGGVGGVVGARLAQHGFDVALVARGKHYEALRDNGLRLETPDDSVKLELPVFDHPAGVQWTAEDVVLLAMKSQDTLAALEALSAVASSNLPVICLQNGVANERIALRRFAHVYGVYVWCAAGHLTPGVVQAWCSPTTGILDIGRYPSGVDELAETLAVAFRSATFLSEVRADVMRWKYRKLLSNLGNAVEALCGSAARGSVLLIEARREGTACLQAADISFAADEENGAAREKQLQVRPIGNNKRPGGSSWQSLARRAHTIETDYLNGEIALLGRTHGIPTPVNEALQRLMRKAARDRAAPGSLTLEQIQEEIN